MSEGLPHNKSHPMLDVPDTRARAGGQVGPRKANLSSL